MIGPAHIAVGIDVGGSGIKGAPVDIEIGEFATGRTRIPTPAPSTPEAVVEVFGEILDEYDLPDNAPIGVAIPAPIDHGVVRSMANLDASWAGVDLQEFVQRSLNKSVTPINDADAAGIAEVRYGAARDVKGVVLVVTLGTGIGSALFVDGILASNTELGHLEIDGQDAESRAAESAREQESLSWSKWAERLQRYFGVVEDLLSPDLFVVGGGVSKKHEKFLPELHLRAPIVPAHLRNSAGIIGAATYAAENQ